MSTRDEATAYTVRVLAEIGISENTSLLHNPGINHLKLGNMIRAAYEAGRTSGLATCADKLEQEIARLKARHENPATTIQPGETVEDFMARIVRQVDEFEKSQNIIWCVRRPDKVVANFSTSREAAEYARIGDEVEVMYS